MHFVPAARVAPQVVVNVKLGELAPFAVADWMVSAAVPGLVIARVCAALLAPTAIGPKLSEVGEKVGGGWVAPVPVRMPDTLPPRSVSRVIVVVSVPADCGLKVKLMVQLAPAAIAVVGLHVVAVWVNDPASPPDTFHPMIVNGMPPLLFSVRLWAELVVPITVDGKLRVLFVNDAFGAVAPVPLSGDSTTPPVV